MIFLSRLCGGEVDNISKNDYPKGIVNFLNTAKYKEIESFINEYNNQLFFVK